MTLSELWSTRSTWSALLHELPSLQERDVLHSSECLQALRECSRALSDFADADCRGNLGDSAALRLYDPPRPAQTGGAIFVTLVAEARVLIWYKVLGLQLWNCKTVEVQPVRIENGSQQVTGDHIVLSQDYRFLVATTGTEANLFRIRTFETITNVAHFQVTKTTSNIILVSEDGVVTLFFGTRSSVNRTTLSTDEVVLDEETFGQQKTNLVAVLPGSTDVGPCLAIATGAASPNQLTLIDDIVSQVPNYHFTDTLAIKQAVYQSLQLDRGVLGFVRRHAPSSVYRISTVVGTFLPPIWAYARKMLAPSKKKLAFLFVIALGLLVASVLSGPEVQGVDLAVPGEQPPPNPFTVFVFGIAEIVRVLGNDTKDLFLPLFDLWNHMVKASRAVIHLVKTTWVLMFSSIGNLVARTFAGIYYSLCMKVPSYRSRPELCMLQISGDQ